MPPKSKLLLTAIALLASLAGCIKPQIDIRDQMLAEATRHDLNFPDGKTTVLTQFSYLGSVDSDIGLLKVVSCRSIITGMPAPRGIAWLSFFSADGSFKGRVPIAADSPPLFCEGTRVFFFGPQSNDGFSGNTLDLKSGINTARFSFVSREGSWVPDSETTEIN